MPDFSGRKGLTFAQAEGLEPIPQQLKLGQLSDRLRARLAKVILESLATDRLEPSYYVSGQDTADIGGHWAEILYDMNTELENGFPEDWSAKFSKNYMYVSNILRNGNYSAVFTLVQFVLEHPDCPFGLPSSIARALAEGQAAYRLEGNIIVPMVSEAEGEALSRSFSELKSHEFGGAREHLANASRYLTAGAWADSARESIHAVESVVRVLYGGNSVGDALKRIAREGHVNANFSTAIGKLYNYSSDQPGIRHSLLEDGDARVDESDALFMLGACASFVTYLISKARATSI